MEWLRLTLRLRDNDSLALTERLLDGVTETDAVTLALRLTLMDSLDEPEWLSLGVAVTLALAVRLSDSEADSVRLEDRLRDAV